MHKPIKYVEKALTYAAQAAWTVFDKANQIKQNPSFTPKLVGKAAAEVLPEDQAPAGLAARDRFALPALRPRDPRGDPERQKAALHPDEREGGRD